MCEGKCICQYSVSKCSSNLDCISVWQSSAPVRILSKSAAAEHNVIHQNIVFSFFLSFCLSFFLSLLNLTTHQFKRHYHVEYRSLYFTLCFFFVHALLVPFFSPAAVVESGFSCLLFPSALLLVFMLFWFVPSYPAVF